MKKQITKISVFQTSKILAVLYVLFGLIYTLIGSLMLIFGGEQVKVMAIIYILMPVILGIFSFIFIALAAWIYNLVASRFGGIEVYVSNIQGD